MKPPFLPHLPLHRIKSHVIVITCLDFQRRQLSHDALPFPAFSRALGQKESHTQLRQDASFSSPLHRSTPEWIGKMPSRGGFFSAERVHFQEAKPKSLHLKSMLLKIMAFLSLFSFYKKNNVQMSLMEINKMREFLISLESTRKYNFPPKPSQVCWIFKLATYLLCC